jgi:hypothetical protein
LDGTPTCVAVRLNAQETLELAAPYGIDDLLHLILRPTSAGRQRKQAYRERIENKKWLQNWPKTQIIWP